MMIRIIQFSSEGCAPCKAQEQILKDVFNDKKFNIPFIFVKMNVDEELKKMFQIIKVPTLLFLIDDTIIDRAEGLLLKTDLINKIKEIYVESV